MAINFPANPTPNDVFTDGSKSWIWDGVTWKIYSSSTTGIGLGDLSVTTLSVGTAALSYNQSTGVFTYTPPDLSSFITQQYTLPTASTTVLGGVKIDGTTITINNGVISGASQGASVSVSDIAPTNPNQGDLWWRSSEGRLKIRYEDGNSNQWVDAFPILDGSTSIAVADESTDTECFPLFSTVATGNLEPKTVNSFKLNSSTGQLEAGSFKKSGGSSSEFLKADGSIDSTSYSTFSGSYTDLTNKPTLVSNLNDLGDVNTTGVANGKILKYDLSTTSWIIADDGGGSGGGGGGGNVAVGSIMIWSGSVANIPTGWQLCDGTNGSPDLRDKFVIGASSDDSGVAKTNVTGSLEQSGGSKDAVVVEHKHTTSVDNHLLFDGNGSQNISYGGAGGYPAQTFTMNNEGVSGTNQNLPPYYALCYIYCTAAGSNQTFIGLDDTPISHSNGKMLQSNGSSLIWVDTPTGFSGNYNDLTNKPTLFSGSYNDLTNKPTLFSGAYNDLTGRPSLVTQLSQLSDVTFSGSPADNSILKWSSSTGKWIVGTQTGGFSGDYDDLTNKPTIPSTLNDLTDVTTTGVNNGEILKWNGSAWAPSADLTGGSSQIQSDWNQTNTGAVDFIKNKPTLFSGSYNDLSNKPTLFSGSYNDLTNKPTIFSGNYNDLTNKPTLFSGAYNDLTGRPTLVTTLGQLTDINITGSPADDSILQYNSSTNEWDVVSGSGLGFSGDYNDLTNKPTIPAAQVNSDWNAVSGISRILNKPNLATVATSGNYNDLINRPNITLPSNQNRILYNNASGVTTTSDNLQFNASTNIDGVACEEIDGARLSMRFRQDNPLRFGNTNGGLTPAPLEIYFDGSNGVIHRRAGVNNTGHLRILCGNLAASRSRTISIVNEDHAGPTGSIPSTGVMAEFTSDGGQKLHWQGSGTKGSRLETTEYGILLKRTDTSLEGGHIQFEDVQGNSRFAIDVYGTTTANSLLRIIDQQTNLQRFCVNKDGAFGVGHVGNEDYGAAGEVLISQGSNAQPTWGTVSGGGSSGVGIGLSGQSLGTAAGNMLVLAQIQATVNNASYLQFKKVRSTNGTDWQTACTRIQQRIDVTDQAYIQFNGTGNAYGMEFGTTNDVLFARFTSGGTAQLYYNGNVKLSTMTDGVQLSGSLYPNSDEDHDLGSSSRRWANLYTADAHFNNIGTGGNEVDGTEGNWTIQEGSDDLFIINRVTGKKYKFNLTEIE